jgi:hypothetical protein
MPGVGIVARGGGTDRVGFCPMGRRKRRKRRQRSSHEPPPNTPSPSVPTAALVDALVEDLRGDGVAAEPGEFTLDRTVALEKLRRYQLAEPRAYVMELVQAASLKGATWIDFSVDTDDLWMRFDGRPFTADELQEVFAAVFRSDYDDEIRAQQELALGLNAAMALRPRWIRVTSGTGGSRVTLDIQQGRHEVEETSRRERRLRHGERDLPAVTTVHVKARWRPELLRRFVKSLRRALPEERILRRRARYSSMDILLNGRVIALGPMPQGAVQDVRFDQENLRVVCGLVPGFDPPKVHWVSNGALITTTELKGSGSEGFEAVVEAGGLRKDVSRTNIVHDELYEEALRLVDRGRSKLRLSSSGQKLQADARFKRVTAELDGIYSTSASRYELLHVIAERSVKVAYALIPINILGMAFLTGFYETDLPWLLVPMGLAVVSFAAPSVCGFFARKMLDRARTRFARHFPRGKPERRLAWRALEKREDDWNGTLAEEMQRRG